MALRLSDRFEAVADVRRVDNAKLVHRSATRPGPPWVPLMPHTCLIE